MIFLKIFLVAILFIFIRKFLIKQSIKKINEILKL